MKLSIALATFNGESHLRQQLDSYLSQTVAPDELVVADDGSDDATLDIIENFASRAPFPINLIKGAHVGFAQNFGRALACTTGDMVFLSDQDDVWEPSKIECVLASAGDALLVVHDLMLCEPDLKPSGITMTDRLARFGLQHSAHIKGCCTAVRRELVELALPIPTPIAHDVFMHRLAQELDRRLFIGEPLIRYRLHESNTSGWTPNSLTPVTRRLMFRLRLRALRKRLSGKPRIDVAAAVNARLQERHFGVGFPQ